MIFRGSGGGPPQFAHTHGCKRTLKSWDNVAVSSTPPRYTTDGWKYNGKWVSSYSLASSETGTMLFDDTPLFHRFQNCSSARNRALRNGTTCGSGAPPQPCSKCCLLLLLLLQQRAAAAACCCLLLCFLLLLAAAACCSSAHASPAQLKLKHDVA